MAYPYMYLKDVQIIQYAQNHSPNIPNMNPHSAEMAICLYTETLIYEQHPNYEPGSVQTQDKKDTGV
jgi:hypothetical protein